MNCCDCKHASVKFSDLSSTEGMIHSYGNTYVNCAAGNSEVIADFYRKNGHKPRVEIEDQLGCFEQTELAKKLDTLIDLTNEALKTVKVLSNEKEN